MAINHELDDGNHIIKVSGGTLPTKIKRQGARYPTSNRVDIDLSQQYLEEQAAG